MFHRQRKDVAVGLGPNASHPPGVGKKTNFAKIRTIGEAGCNLAITHDNVDNTLLDKVHFVANCTFSNDYVT
jgi:hypothetical protein